MSRIHQVLVSASPGDAITNAALDLRGGLRREGPSEIFAAFVHPDLDGEAHPLDDFPRRAAGADLVVLHASIGEPAVSDFLQRRAEPLGVVYHNMSPAAVFEPWEPAFAALLAHGRRELAGLASRARVAVAVSELNAAELRAMGFAEVHVVPLVVEPSALAGMEPDPTTVAQLDGLDGPVVLHVGQLLPHKRVDWLVSAYHALVTHLLPEARLVLVGADRLAAYGTALRRLVAELNLTRAHLLGSVSQASLVAAYRRAQVFVTASEHEGFCVPLLEAMAFSVPVVARRFAAVPETLRGAGLLLEPDDGPLVGAEAMAEVLAGGQLATALVRLGRRRVDELDPEGSRAALVGALRAAAA